MSADWYLMDSYPIYNGGYEGDEHFAYARQGFQEILDTTALRDCVEFINSDFTVIKPGKAIVQNNTADTESNDLIRQILTPIGTLKDFSYVRFEDVIYIIASEPSNNKFYEKSILKPCLNQLKWQDPITKEIFSYWYWLEDMTRYGAGLYSGSVLTKFDAQLSLLLPMDKNTRKLHDGMRFIMEMSNDIPMVYKLNRFQGLTKNFKNVKLLCINLTQTVFDEDRDNLELMIADYNIDASVSNKVNCRINYESNSIALNSVGIFEAVFNDYKGDLVDCDFDWNVSCDEFDISNLKISFEGNKIKIIVTNNKDLIGKSFSISVLVDGVIFATLDINIIALW